MERGTFLGLRAAELPKLAEEYRELALDQLCFMLRSAVHENRMIALLILVLRARRGDAVTKRQIYDLYLAQARYINNWDLVGASAREIVGGYLADKGRRPLFRLARSQSLCERRISIVVTRFFIRQKDLGHPGFPGNAALILRKK
jgi:3-methyladenine DNA glycosylase AlkD